MTEPDAGASWPAPGGGPPVPPPPGAGAPPPPPPPQPGYGPPPGYGLPQYGAPRHGAPQYGAPQYGNPGGYPGGFQQPYAAVAPKPGIIPLRPLAVSEILDGAFATIRRHPRATLGLSATVACVQQSLLLLTKALSGTLTNPAGFIQTTPDPTAPNGETTTFHAGQAVTFFVGLGVTLLITTVLGLLLTGALSLVVSDSVLGHETSAGSAWKRLRPQAWRLVGLSLLVGLAELVGLAFCLLPGVFLWGALALTVPSLVLERTTVGGAWRRSWHLAVPSFWRVLGIRLLGFLIAGVLIGVLNIAGGLFGAPNVFAAFGNNGATTVHISALGVVVQAITGVIGVTLTAPFLAGLLTLLYIDRRIRAEALDVQLAQAAAKPTSYGTAATYPTTSFG